MDIFELIKADHRKFDALFSEIETTDNTEKLYTSFNQLYKELYIHSRAEELTFYPALRQCNGTGNMFEEAEEKHVEAEEMLEEIQQLSPTSSEFKDKMMELKKSIQHHVQEEENEIFAKVSKYINPQELKQIEKEFKQMKIELEEYMPVVSI